MHIKYWLEYWPTPSYLNNLLFVANRLYMHHLFLNNDYNLEKLVTAICDDDLRMTCLHIIKAQSWADISLPA